MPVVVLSAESGIGREFLVELFLEDSIPKALEDIGLIDVVI